MRSGKMAVTTEATFQMYLAPSPPIISREAKMSILIKKRKRKERSRSKTTFLWK
jgi:hypothetical protein